MKSLVIVGDTLLDRDVDGEVRRLAPDGPAPVLEEESSVDRPGGAGLAALLSAGQGYEVSLVTALASDEGGARLACLLTAAGVNLYAARAPGHTPEKIRMRGSGQVLLRLDRGGDGPGEPAEVDTAALDAIRDAAVVLVSDYGRGLARAENLREALASTAAPVVWDPHPRGPAAVPNTRLVTPNETELRALTDGVSGPRLSAVARGAAQLRDRWRAGAVAVTMGGNGALLCHAGPTPLVVPAPIRADGDACGAGDRFAVSAAAALADGALVSEAVQSAVTDASAYVSAGGPESLVDAQAASTVSGRDQVGELAAQVRARNGTVVATGGCFDLLHAGHVATLQAARRLGDCLVVCINSDRSVTELKGPDRPLVNQHDRARLLTALGCVDAVVVFDEPTPHAVLSWLRPDVWVKGGDYGSSSPALLPEADLVHRWGGQTVVVPYLAGRSTSRLVDSLRRNNG